MIYTTGFLPFSAIYVELYYILVSAWGHKLFHPPFSILCICFVILILVTAFITVALTYFQLAAEDHRWWWRSFLAGGSTGIFLFGYSTFFFIHHSDMRGFYQVCLCCHKEACPAWSLLFISTGRVFLWVHGDGMLGVFHYAGHGRVAGLTGVQPCHFQGGQGARMVACR